MRNDILRFLKQESGDEVFFTTMIDLYGLHSDFPGIEEAERLRQDPQARVRSLEASWSGDIGDQRFIPFIQLHEFEALGDIASLQGRADIAAVAICCPWRQYRGLAFHANTRVISHWRL